MEEEVKEQIREMVRGLEVKGNAITIIYVAKVEARKIVVETPKKS